MLTPTRTFTLAALVTAVLSQTSPLDQLPAACKTAIETLANNSDVSTCLGINNIDTMASVVLGNSTDSLVGFANTWLTEICAVPACSDATLKTITDGLEKGCDLGITNEIQLYYPTIRKALCLQEGSTNCVTQTLTNIEKVIGTPLNIETIGTIPGDQAALLKLADAKEAYCTDCTKSIYSTLVSGIPELAQAGYAPILEQQCGATFTDGKVASTVAAVPIKSTANTTDATSNTDKSAALGSVAMIYHGIATALGASAVILILSSLV